MPTYTIISGSVRPSRTSHRVTLHLKELLEKDPSHYVQVIDLAEANLPVMNDLWDKHPQHIDAFTQLAETLLRSDAFIWVSPEYNGSYTPALKNFIDHFPIQAFYRKPVGIVSVSTGAMGGIRGGLNMQELALAVQGYVIPQMLLVPQVTHKFDTTGNMIDETFMKKLHAFLAELTWLTQALYRKEVKSKE